MTIRIVKATEADIPLVLEFIRKLAEYERLTDRLAVTPENLHLALFGELSFVEVLLAYIDAQPAGFAVYFQSFSTFLGRPGIYLEDVFVELQHRRGGVGTSLMAAVAQRAIESGGSLNWSVLKWNQSAIDFYTRLGAVELADWSGYRLDGTPLAQLAAKTSSKRG